MKKLLLGCLCVSVLLVGCGGPKDLKISEMNEPKNAQKLKDTLTPEESKLLMVYIINHTLKQDLNDKTTVQQAIDSAKKENGL